MYKRQTRVNQENRIKLMLSVARENLNQEEEVPQEDKEKQAEDVYKRQGKWYGYVATAGISM